MKRTVTKLSVALATVLTLIGCGKKVPSFTLLPDSDLFQQNKAEVNTKIDVLWVVDNSGSMQTSQEKLANNFSSFISGFNTKNFDFQMAVTTTEAYRAPYDHDPDMARFRDGTDATSHSNVFVITPGTPNLIDTFIVNVLQGTLGTGDERAFQSFRESLNSSLNAGFLRSDSFLSVIIVSDEDDLSHDGSNWLEVSHDDPRLDPVQDYVDYLDLLTDSTGANRRYNVSAMAILDQECKDELTLSWGGRKIGHRYQALVEATGGVSESLCGDFSVLLENISDNILQLATQFYLTRLPVPETIEIVVNGEVVPQVDANTGPKTGGWSYNSEANSIVFHGDYIPPQGSTIQVDFDPVGYGS